MHAHSDARATTIRNEDRDFPEWHRGRPRYALWALAFDTADLLPRMREAQRALADLLLPRYVRQPHVTLGLCGFPSATPVHGDEFGPDLLQRQLRALQAVRPAAFDIHIGALDCFSTVPYFTVRDTAGQLQALRRDLQPAQPAHGDYTPHVTLGLFADAFPLQAVQARLGAVALPPALCLPVTGLSLLTYAASEIGGPLQCAASYGFAQQRLQWHEAPWFPLNAELLAQ